MNNLLDRIRSGELLVADGAMGTMLMATGLPSGMPPEIMNLENEEAVAQVAHAYAEAGSDIVLTNSFGGSPLRLAHYQLESHCDEINRRAVRAARRGAGERTLVAASVGPSGDLLEPFGPLSAEQVRISFERQIAALLEESVDMICIETMTDLTEALLAVQAARRLSNEIPISATLTFNSGPRGFFTLMGNSIEETANRLGTAGADLIGSNCGNGSEVMVEIAAEFRRLSDLPLVIQANAGLPLTTNNGLVYPESPDDMAKAAAQLITAGVNIIGGCCGTTPEHIRATREVVDNIGTR